MLIGNSWIESALRALKFLEIFIQWIFEFITGPSFSVLVNGFVKVYFKSKRGPFSPYLFAVVMEFFFSAPMSKCALDRSIPTPFSKGELAIFHLLFADDLNAVCYYFFPGGKEY